MLLADEEAKEGDPNNLGSLNEESQKYQTGYIAGDGLSGKNSAASGRINQDQDPEFGQHDMQAMLSKNASEGGLQALPTEEIEEDGIGKFFGNIRSLRAGKQTKRMNESKKLLRRKRQANENDIRNEYDSDEDTSQLLNEYYQDKLNTSHLSGETDTSTMSFISRKQALGHLMMFLMLIEILMLFVKNYVVKDPYSYSSYSYLVAFGLPMLIVCLAASDLIYEKYIAKFQSSHPMIYQKFLFLLVVMTISSISFVLMFSIFLSEPNSLKVFGILSIIPFYLCWLIMVGVYIFISPGLLDPVNNIPFYQVVMAAIYLLFGLIYPIYLSFVISKENLKEINTGDPEVTNPNQHTIISADEALCVNIPIIALFGIHICAILPQFVCQCNRKMEFLIMASLIGIFSMEILRD